MTSSNCWLGALIQTFLFTAINFEVAWILTQLEAHD